MTTAGSRKTAAALQVALIEINDSLESSPGRWPRRSRSQPRPTFDQLLRAALPSGERKARRAIRDRSSVSGVAGRWRKRTRSDSCRLASRACCRRPIRACRARRRGIARRRRSIDSRPWRLARTRHLLCALGSAFWLPAAAAMTTTLGGGPPSSPSPHGSAVKSPCVARRRPECGCAMRSCTRRFAPVAWPRCEPLS
jgi:hypothetical protein